MQTDRLKAAHRGAPENPANRFEKIHLEPDEEWNPDEDHLPRTQLFVDHTVNILSENDSPDIGFRYGLNPYRGCEHGCIYCYARPTHEYLGFSSGLDFESKIMVKTKAPELLREKFSSPKWQPEVIVMSSNTDCYQPIERKLKLTRGCLAVFAEFLNPVGIITKNALVTRDIDLLSVLARHQAVHVTISLTSLDPKIRSVMEPRTSPPGARLDAIRKLRAAGISVGVNVAPIVPGLTDHEIPAILKAAAEAGAMSAWYTIVRLPYAVAPMFEKWLEIHFPDRKEKVLNYIRSMRDGKLYKADWGTRMRGAGLFAEQIEQMFTVARRKAGIDNNNYQPLSTAAFRRAGGSQLSLFS